MNRDKLKALYLKYELTSEDIYKHQHYVIITRQGIEKIQAKENITITYEVVKCETNFAVFKAKAFISTKPNTILETFGSALKAANYKDGNCNSWYVAEMAEKRALQKNVKKKDYQNQLGLEEN